MTNFEIVGRRHALVALCVLGSCWMFGACGDATRPVEHDPGPSEQIPQDSGVEQHVDANEPDVDAGSKPDAPIDLLPSPTLHTMAASSAGICVIGRDHQVHCFGRNAVRARGESGIVGERQEQLASLAPVPLTDDVRAVSVGGSHVCAITTGGKVLCWGRNSQGQLGSSQGSLMLQVAYEPDQFVTVDLGKDLQPRAVQAGGNHTCVLFTNGRVKCWGANQRGQLGLGDAEDRGDDPNELGDNLPFVELGEGRTVSALSTGDEHTCAILDDGTVKCWGTNFQGQLGHPKPVLGDQWGDAPEQLGDALPIVDLGGPDARALSIAASAYGTCTILNDGHVRCWSELFDSPILEPALPGTAVSVALGNHEVWIALADGRVACVSDDAASTVSLGSRPSDRAIEVVAHRDDACVRFASGEVFCTQYAERESGQVPSLETAFDFGTAGKALSVSVGLQETRCAVFEDQRVRCWGDNSSGQLGIGDSEWFGNNPNEASEGAPPIDLGTDTTVSSVAMTEEMVCALIQEGRVKCWGPSHSVPPAKDYPDWGLDVGDAPNEIGDALPALALGAKARTVSGAWNGEFYALLENGRIVTWPAFSPFGPEEDDGIDNFPLSVNPADAAPRCAVYDDGSVWCLWSEFVTGMASSEPFKLGLKDDQKAAALAVGSSHICVLLRDGEVVCTAEAFSFIEDWSLGIVPIPFGKDRKALRIAAGAGHTCALLDDHTVWCWGYNVSGVLGIENSFAEWTPGARPVDLGTGRTPVEVAAGGDNTCVRFDDDSIKCWGDNSSGQLGLGDSEARGDQRGEMGDALPTMKLSYDSSR